MADAGPFQTRLAEHGDTPAILSIQRYWLALGESSDRSRGYLSGGDFSSAQITQLVDARAVAVVELRDEIIGYYFFDNVTDHVLTEQNREHIRSLNLPFKRVCPRAQAAILPEYHHFGLSRLLVQHLVHESRTHFDAVFATVAKDNPKLAAHLRVGWKIVGEDADFIHVVLPLTE